MPKADPNLHNPHPGYLRHLVGRIGVTDTLAARIMGVNPRNFRHMLNGRQVCPYPVQFFLEWLAENPPQKGDIDWEALRLKKGLERK